MKYTEQKFNENNVTVDFNEYIRCEFTNSKIIFTGGDLPVFEDCTFSNCQFTLQARADNTLGYLSFLYQNLGNADAKAFVEEQIGKIKG
jgi:hypothetical protein